tara:strand:+ start:816 stop:1652 length:837 start_codon:yes stop_codon:yes gene_type:complete
MTQWICNGGCPRSGTTAFLEVFNQHPNIAMFPEYNFFTLIDKFDDLFYKEANTRAKGWIGNINANERPGSTVITKDFLKYIPQKEKGHQRHVIKSMFEAVFPDKDLKVIGEKLPFYFQQDLYKLNKRVGPIKYVHITRNPLWVINSFRHRTKLVEQGKDLWKFRDFNEACNIWISAWNFLVEARNELDILPIKYENFFDNPINARKEVFDFLHVEDYNVRNFVGDKYGPLDALTTEEWSNVNKLFEPLIRDWDAMSMTELLDSHGPFTQDMATERLKS